MADRARTVAYRLARTVDADGAYANLALPSLITQARLDARDAAFATELGYGTLRAAGTLDEILARCITRPFRQVQPEVRDLVRLGAYQLLRTRVPPHAAVTTTVELAVPGPAWTGQAGSGDTLAGLCAAVLAAGRPAHEAAVLAASLQAVTAATHPGPLPPHVLAERCADQLGAWWRERQP